MFSYAIISSEEISMKMRVKLGLIVALGLCITMSYAAQISADMVGTWSGLATLEGMDDANELVLVLTMEEGSLTGHMTDEYGTMTESAISEVKLEKSLFNFSVKGYGPDGAEITLVFKMEVDGDSMTGTLEIPDMGMTGNWESSKQK
jgi:hypothetical protein